MRDSPAEGGLGRATRQLQADQTSGMQPYKWRGSSTWTLLLGGRLPGADTEAPASGRHKSVSPQPPYSLHKEVSGADRWPPGGGLVLLNVDTIRHSALLRRRTHPFFSGSFCLIGDILPHRGPSCPPPWKMSSFRDVLLLSGCTSPRGMFSFLRDAK